MTVYKRVSNIINNSAISLIVNRTSSECLYDILKFQPKGKMSYSSDQGIHCNEAGFVDKVNEFIDMAVSNQPALVVTPEASIPYSVLHNIIDNEKRWPDTGRLWCLCMSGISKIDFIKFKKNLEEISNIKVFIEADINYSEHINSLFYLFRLDNKQLAIIIQLKNAPMSDREINHEADHLSKGNTVYIFDLNSGEPTKNVLLNLICADAIQLSVADLITALKYTYPLIINPQCNKAPFNFEFVYKRNAISSDSNLPKCRILVANWSKGSKIEGAFTINDSGNAYYNHLSANGYKQIKNICENKDSFTHRMKNQIMGATYFANEKLNIWKFPDEENILSFYIRKEEVFGVNENMSSRFDPVIKGKYEYDFNEKNWKKAGKNCIFRTEKVNNNLYISDNKLLRPINYEKCISDSCQGKCMWLYNDYFLGICFGGSIKTELTCELEKSNRTLIGLSAEGKRNTSRKRELFMTLVKILEENEIPIELNIFSNNIRFDIDKNAAEVGSNNIYNVSTKKSPDQFPCGVFKKGVFAIIDTNQIEVVERTYDKLYKSTNEENRDQILLYYRNNNKYIPYLKPHEQTSIKPKNSFFTNNVSSVFKGEGQYEQD